MGDVAMPQKPGRRANMIGWVICVGKQNYISFRNAQLA